MLAGTPTRSHPAARLFAVAIAAALLAFLFWPYLTIWRLDSATRSTDPADLAGLVDMESIRNEIKKKLNKDSASSIDTLSDPFIRWLEEGIQLMGSEAVDRLVTQEWVRTRLLAHSGPGDDQGFLGQVTYAFFEIPDGFRLRIGEPHDDPVEVRLQLSGVSWRITALYH